MAKNTGLAESFDDERSRLLAVAYRLLGSRADAEDAVQEAWLRLSRSDPQSIDNLRGWLTTVVSRICIDTLRSRSTRKEVSIDHNPIDLIAGEMVVAADTASPEDTALLADNVGIAMLVVLQSLRPDERLAFILHDTFAVPFSEIADVLGKTTDATKMLASRARRKVHHHQLPDEDRQEQREVVDAFLSAAQDGDFDALLRILAPDVTWHRLTAHGMTTNVGADHVTEALRRGRKSRVTTGRVLVNGQPGIMAWSPNGTPLSVMACTVQQGRMVEMVSIIDPARLARLDLPDPATGGETDA